MDNGILIVVGIIYFIILIGAISLFIHFKRKAAFKRTLDSKQQQTIMKKDEYMKQ